MDGVLAHIQALSGSPSDLNQLSSQLRATQLVPHATAIPEAVQSLDASAHGLGMTFLLWVLPV